MLLTIAGMWRKFITRGEHDRKCGLDLTITKTEVEAALNAASREQDLKLAALDVKLGAVENKVDSTKDDLKEAITQSKKDLSGKIGLLVALLTKEQNNVDLDPD